jgi:hypothetical protein
MLSDSVILSEKVGVTTTWVTFFVEGGSSKAAKKLLLTVKRYFGVV